MRGTAADADDVDDGAGGGGTGVDLVDGDGDALTGLGLGPDPLPALEAMVAAQLGRGRVRLQTVRLQAHPYDRPALLTAARHLVRGTAADDCGHVDEFAFVVKIVQAWTASPLAAEVPEPLRSQIAPLMPWRTEPEVYRSDLGRRLPRGLRLARARRVVDLTDDTAAVWLDRVPVRHVRWDVARHRPA